METLDRLLFDAETSDQFIRQLMSSLVITSQSSKDLPTGTEYDFQKSFKSFSSLCDQSSEQIINLIEGIMQYVKPGFQFNMSDDFLDSSVYEHIIDMIDALLENVDLKLDNDEIKGKDAFKPLRLSVAVDKDRIMRSNIKDIPKPQLQFLHDIDNSRDRPFKPRLKSKPWAVEPLKLTEIPMVLTDSDIITAKYYYSHPYEIELRTLRYPEWQKTNPTLIDPIMPSHQQPFQYIYREEDLEGLIQELLNVREIAIDLENHSYRSFQGFTCLMQISSRQKDFVIDAIALRLQLSSLGVIFANPNIVKVLHGSENDVLWLQRDFGLYLVNVFDTYHAAKMLQYPALSLSHLVKYHCNITINKKHQLSDWRIRPLPLDMLVYAKDDTHYLLYIYDCLRRDIWKALGKEALEAVLDSSRKTCLKRYEKEPFWPPGYRKLLNGSCKITPQAESISDTQDSVMAALWNWRDLKAREFDESVWFIMSNSEILRLGIEMPRNELALSHCGPLSDFVRNSSKEIVDLINRTVDIRPISHDALKAISSKGLLKFNMYDDGSNEGEDITSEFASASDGFISSNDITHRRDKLYGRALKTPSREILENNFYNNDTVCTFTPAVRMTPLNAPQSVDRCEELSPVMTAEEIYRMAGWSTPGPNDLEQNPASPLFSDSLRERSTELGLESQEKWEKARQAVQELARSSTSSFLHDSMNKTSEKGQEGKTSVTLVDVAGMRLVEESQGSLSRTSRSYNSDDQNLMIGYENDHSLTEKAMNRSRMIDITGDGIDNSNDRVIIEVPQSFHEIYEISNLNRRRNKDKKRFRGGEIDDDDNQLDSLATTLTSANEELAMIGSDSDWHNDTTHHKMLPNELVHSIIFPPLHGNDLNDNDASHDVERVMNSALFDENIYFSINSEEHAATSADINNTLDFAQSLGWVKSNYERSTIKEAYLAEQEAQNKHDQDDKGNHQEQTTSSKSSSYSKANNRTDLSRANDSNSKPFNAGGSGKGGGGVRGNGRPKDRPSSGGKRSTPPRQPNVQLSKSLDFSKIPSHAMNAVALNPSATINPSGRHPSNVGGVGNRANGGRFGQQTGSFNPYLSRGVNSERPMSAGSRK